VEVFDVSLRNDRAQKKPARRMKIGREVDSVTDKKTRGAKKLMGKKGWTKKIRGGTEGKLRHKRKTKAKNWGAR